MGEQIKAKACQAIFVGDGQHSNLVHDNAIHERQEFGPLEVESPANLTDSLVYGKPTGSAKLLKHGSLIRQVRLLCLTRYPHIHHGSALCDAPAWEGLVQMLIGIEP